MARPREFDTDAVIVKAMDVFWTYGYEGASLQDLLDGMEIARGSLYKAFEDKKSLFMTVLECYEREAVAPAVEILSGPPSKDGSDRIKMIFRHVIGAVRAGDRRGCLICSAAAGPAAEDPEIAKAVHRALDQMRKGFEVAIAASRTHAQLDPKEHRGLADVLTTQYVGLRVLVRAHAPVAVLERSAASIQKLLALAK